MEAQKYMQKNINELKETNPGRAYKVLKRMGAQPGDCSENDTFILPNHEIEVLSPEQSAERIAQHFAEISQQFPPLDVNLLPDRVTAKLQTVSSPPLIEDYEVYDKINLPRNPSQGYQVIYPGSLRRNSHQNYQNQLTG